MTLKRTGPPPRRTALRRTGRINPISKRRRKRDKDYDKARAEVWASQGGVCAVQGCEAGMVDAHHRAGRRGKDPHRRANLVGLCDTHHRFVHANKEWAVERGLSVWHNREGVA